VQQQPFVELRILGHTELSSHGDRTGSFVLRQPKRIALLAYLAMATAGGYRRRDQIVALFWPELDQTHARTQLRKVLHALRSTIGSDTLVSRGEEEIRLDPSLFWCDAVAFTQCVEQGQWHEASELYRGELLEGLFPGGVGEQFQSWLEDQRVALRKQAAIAAWECSSREDLAGRRREALAMARRAVELEPDDEEGVRRLIAVLDRYGDRASALQVFAKWQTRLQSEFGADPAPETRKLARKVQAPRAGESLETPSGTNPITAERLTPSAPASAVQSSGILHPAPRSKSFWIRLSAILAALLTTVGVVGGKVIAARPEATIAVLPFYHLDDSTDTRLGGGLAEELTAELARVAGVTVRSTASRGPRVDTDDASTMARHLRVAFVIDGTIRGTADRMRVSVRLVRAKDGVNVWSRMFDTSGLDLLSAQESVAKSVIAEVKGLLGTQR
jgi:DNA-binding SARP family transcriptional activator/TolB-like protein